MEEERGWGREGNRDKPLSMRVGSVLFNVPSVSPRTDCFQLSSSFVSQFGLLAIFPPQCQLSVWVRDLLNQKKSWFRVGTWGEVLGISNPTTVRETALPAPQLSPPVVASTPSTIPHPGRAVRPISSARIHDGVGAGILCSCVPRSLHNPTSPTLQASKAGSRPLFRGSVDPWLARFSCISLMNRDSRKRGVESISLHCLSSVNPPQHRQPQQLKEFSGVDAASAARPQTAMLTQPSRLFCSRKVDDWNDCGVWSRGVQHASRAEGEKFPLGLLSPPPVEKAVAGVDVLEILRAQSPHRSATMPDLSTILIGGRVNAASTAVVQLSSMGLINRRDRPPGQVGNAKGKYLILGGMLRKCLVQPCTIWTRGACETILSVIDPRTRPPRSLTWQFDLDSSTTICRSLLPQLELRPNVSLLPPPVSSEKKGTRVGPDPYLRQGDLMPL